MFACSSLILLVAFASLDPQGAATKPRAEQENLVSLLEKRDYTALAKLLSTDSRKSLLGFGKDASALIALRPAQLRAVLKSLALLRGVQAQVLIETQLRTLLLSHRGDPIAACRAFVGFLDHTELRPSVVSHVARGAMQLCRFGDPAGMPILEKILEFYPGQVWAISNLANSLRFLGRYKRSMRLFEGLLAGPDRAWTLNSLGLCYQAQGLLRQALALYLRGAEPKSAGRTADKNTCRTNAALLLWQTGRNEDRAKAGKLLDWVKDPTATRAIYWRRQIQREEESQSSHR